MYVISFLGILCHRRFFVVNVIRARLSRMLMSLVDCFYSMLTVGFEVA